MNDLVGFLLKICSPWMVHVFAFGFMAIAVSPANAEIRVADYLPDGYVKDGSVSYRAEIQRAIDAAARSGQTLRFDAMDFQVDSQGWQLRSRLSIAMQGATFRLSADCSQDGAVFHGVDISDVTIVGGRFVGRNDVWQDGVNIRGVHVQGKSSRIRMAAMHFENLSSNGIGVFGSEEEPIRAVWISDVTTENCCKRYPDYLSGEKSEKGSVREDQGDVALYFVHDFVVRGCRFSSSRSDGTHFYRCRNGQITANRIQRAKMGGYFLEGCHDVVGTANVILDNGSRGTTIERGSTHCVFSNNIVRGSGREGLWAPDCIGLVVTGNVFDRNGRKPNGPEKRFIWNANITINEAHRDPSESPTQDYLISDNMIRTSPEQVAAIRVDAVAETKNIVIRGNVLLGENRKVDVSGPNAHEVILNNNAGTDPDSTREDSQ